MRNVDMVPTVSFLDNSIPFTYAAIVNKYHHLAAFGEAPALPRSSVHGESDKPGVEFKLCFLQHRKIGVICLITLILSLLYL